jgi:hypothetical protein
LKKLSGFKDTNEFEEWLRTFMNWAGDKYVYDFNLIVHFFLALLDNLRKNGGGDLEFVGYSFTDPQRKFITELAKYANQVTDKDIENEDI